METKTDDLRTKVENLIREEIAPALQMDGTSIAVTHIEDGIAFLNLGGICGSCASSVMAVLMGIEQELRAKVPEIEFVELSESQD